jgi:ADP-dependent NAD(P)H-hydrate dehydratase
MEHKGDFGHVLVIGGARGMAGAVALSAISALRSGCGLVTAAVPEGIQSTVAHFHPCVMTHGLPEDLATGGVSDVAVDWIGRNAKSYQAIAIGPGMGRSDAVKEVIRWVIESLDVPRVIDADALWALSQLRDWPEMLHGPIVLTPHAGEFERISGVSRSDRSSQEQAAHVLADQSGCVVLLKGAGTLITAGGTFHRNTTGNAGMATAGCGDVLTGMIASLMAQGMPPFDAARLGAHAHGLAGDHAAKRLGEVGMTALDVLESIPQAWIDIGTE